MRGFSPSFFSVAGALAVIVFCPDHAWSQQWPPAQMQMVIPHEVGSSQNQTTRAFGEAWEKQLGTRFVYDNRTGASGRVGYEFFLGLAKDCSAVMSTNVGSASIMYAQQKPAWKWEERLSAVGVFTVDPGAIFVSAKSKHKTFSEIIEQAKTKPMTLGVSFWASPENLQIHQLMNHTGAKFQVIPVGASTELVTQVIGGHIEVGFANVAVTQRGGDMVRVVAVPMDSNPVPHLTDNAPTADAAAGTTSIGVASYRAILAHKECTDAHPERAKKLRETFEAATKDPAFIEKMKSLGVDPSLVVAMTAKEVEETVIRRNWDAVEKFGKIYQQGK
jgi:tripartite-type tricarboxylate transporter receptor subunit TctC